ncbi:neuropeptide S receptor-like [Littorina saxatilis]|uniref:neuropeptide S receptor-like n=1 Tax=Littorina saxatilis TaxID=31220 RepID=UPI0038B58FFB
MSQRSPGTSRSSNDDVTTGSTRQELDPYNVDEFLNQKNAEYVSNAVPTIVFIAVVMVAGIVGNTLVFNVYYRRFKPSVSRTCILAMSNLDFLLDVCALPLQITEICFSATFYSVWACKMSRSFSLFLVLFSAIVLVAVSVERQTVICSKRHLSLKSGYLCILYCGVAAFVLALPYAVVTGKHTLRFPGSNITGAQCSISDEYKFSAFFNVYTSIVGLAYVLCVVIMSVSYGRIVRHLWFHKKTMATFTSSTDAALSLSRHDLNTQLQTEKKSEVKGQVKDIPKRTTIMMFVLTMMFVSTYLPYLVIKMLDQRTSGEFTRSLDLNFGLIGLRLYFINSAVNPIVYCFFSRRFRDECLRLFWDKRRYTNAAVKTTPPRTTMMTSTFSTTIIASTFSTTAPSPSIDIPRNMLESSPRTTASTTSPSPSIDIPRNMLESSPRTSRSSNDDVTTGSMSPKLDSLFHALSSSMNF